MLAILASAASAQQLTFDAVTRVEAGRDDPSLSLHAAVPGSLSVALSCGSRSYAWKGQLGAGATHVVKLTGLPEGSSSCAGTVRLDEPSGAWAEAPLSFQVALLPPITFEVQDSDWDRERRRLVVHPSRPVVDARASVVGEGGREIEDAYGMLVDPSNPVFELSTREEVLQIVVRVKDEAGIMAELVLSPWYYAIPHEDLVFASGSAVITAAEAPKLERTWTTVREVLDKYGRVVKIKLYVAGYTDTVGSSASNLELSRRRAQAIARWFRDRGFPGEVYWQGFGEEALAVPTPDETDALPNRRALYLLAAERPPVTPDLPASDWSR